MNIPKILSSLFFSTSSPSTNIQLYVFIICHFSQFDVFLYFSMKMICELKAWNQGRRRGRNIFHGLCRRDANTSVKRVKGFVVFGPEGWHPRQTKQCVSLILFLSDNKDLSLVIFRFRIYHIFICACVRKRKSLGSL